MSDRPVLARMSTPDRAVMAASRSPTTASPLLAPGASSSSSAAWGPSRWLMVVVSFEQEPARIVTALGHEHGSSQPDDALNIKIDGLTFDRADYDADGDVLYLARGESADSSETGRSPPRGTAYGTAATAR